MKKQLLRVKQLASENLGRAEKTDDLTDQLQQLEKRVESVKHACQTTIKKLQSCLLSASSELDKMKNDIKTEVLARVVKGKTQKAEPQRRKKKLPQFSLSTSLMDASSTLDDEKGSSTLRKMLEQCGCCQEALAANLVAFEMNVEQEIIAPMASIVEDEIKPILHARKSLGKTRLDMDSYKSRWTSAAKASSAGNAVASSKVDQKKDKYEDSIADFHQAQDALTVEMLQFCSHELRHAALFKKLLELQAEYHKESLRLLDTVLPNLTEMLDKSTVRPVFGCPLSQHLNVSKRKISFVIEECVSALMQIALETEGLFRLTGSAMNGRKLKAMFNAGCVDMTEFVTDVHAIAGTLKLYLRELPEPLLTFALYDQWVHAGRIENSDDRLQTLWTLVRNLPPENLANFQYLMAFFNELTKYSKSNKMTPTNIALVIAPNVIWSKKETDSAGMMDTSIKSRIIEAFIQHFDWFFPERVDLPCSPVKLSSSPVPRPRSRTGSTSSGSSLGGKPPLPVAPPRRRRDGSTGSEPSNLDHGKPPVPRKRGEGN